MENPHARTVEEVIKYFDTDINFGLSDKQIEEYQEKYGPNGEIIFMFIVYKLIGIDKLVGILSRVWRHFGLVLGGTTDCAPR